MTLGDLGGLTAAQLLGYLRRHLDPRPPALSRDSRPVLDDEFAVGRLEVVTTERISARV